MAGAMKRGEIDPAELELNTFSAWGKDWFLLTAGENKPGGYNTMTVAWGSFGVMWQKPFAQIVVRPSRHTMTFLEGGGSFTLSAFPADMKKVLTFCGTKSGRDVDKISETGLTPIASKTVSSPGFDQASLIIECRVIYRDLFRPENFLADYIEPCYNGSDYHHVLFGEITRIEGTEDYRP